MLPVAAQKLQVFFDGACPICSREVGYARRRDRGEIEWVDIAAPAFNAADYGLDALRITQAMHARLPDGTVVTGVDAAIQVMRRLQRSILSRILLFLLSIPGMMPLARLYYRWFAKNRYRFTGRCTPESCELPPAPHR